MRILVVSSVPPTRCGIAAYATQQIQRLREQGHTVEVASLDGGGEADFHFRLKRAQDIAALTSLVRRSAYERAYLHYQHDFFFDGLEKRQLLSHNLLLAGLFSRGFEVICHEVVYGLLAGDCGRAVQATERLKWLSARRLWVHTAHERTRLSALLPAPPIGPPIDRREHHADFRAFRNIDQAAARAELGIPVPARVLLCIGFLQSNKGFDRALRAFASLRDPGAQLYVVGSARLPRAETRMHIQELKSLAAADDRIRLIERFLSDEEFDTWIAASDAVVVPYREIWSSGVVGRAKLLGKRVVAAEVGGLAGQLGPDDVVVGAGDDLAQAMSRGLERQDQSPRRQGVAPRLRLGVVAPWYGPGVPGGAERVIRETSERLARAGVQVEVFTTQIRDYFADWSRNQRPAEELVGGIAVHRFPVEPRKGEAFGPIAERASRGESLAERELEIFFGEMIRCPGLSRALAARREEFDLFLLGHYMFATTLESARAVGDRAVVMPFLHDEGYARLAPYGDMFRAARGALFMSAPEAELAQRLFGIPTDRCAVVGTGLLEPPAVSRFAFARRYGLPPYVLYVGRKEEGKGFPLLLDLFRAYRATRPQARLVLIGPGTFEPGSADSGSIRDLGVVGEREKLEALAGASVLIQPSRLESFSLSIMEAWQVGRPVLVNQACAVTSHHVAQARGGLAFHDRPSFAEAVDRLTADPRLAARLGRNGKAYVKREFGWPEVLQRTLAALESFRRARRNRSTGKVMRR
jgi:glycosyltransferase involved in cell wall biosynthesis